MPFRELLEGWTRSPCRHIRRGRGDGERGRLMIPALVVGGIALLVLSCGDDGVGPAPPPPPPPPAPVATTVTVNPGSASFTALGETVRFTAEVRDQSGQVMAGAAVAWASSDASVATADASGQVTSAGNGTATITARAGSASGAAEVTVAQEVDAIVVSPAAATLVAFGDTVRLVAEATDANGHGVAGLDVSWSSSDVGVAKVDDTGLVEAVAEGTATITAEAGDASGEAEITTVENPDRSALVALYEATDGPNWVDNTNWLTDAPLSEWYGVTTDPSGRVVELDLSGRRDGVWTSHGLSGTIPPELANLRNLESLDLQVNALKGTIPPELGDLSNLRSLALGQNSLRGVIPPELGRLTNLERLNLRYNILSDSIPPELGELTSLKYLELGANELTGPIPPELGGLAILESLGLGSNNLTGAIPTWLPDLTELKGLSLEDNELRGPIPAVLGNFIKLNTLRLEENNLSGSIPVELANLDDLRWLTLYDSNLTGLIPPELGQLTRLWYLGLWGNDLTGPIPPELGDLANLRFLTLADNNLTGPVPPELGNLTRLREISLSGNQLTGSLPLSFAGLNNVESLGCQRTRGVCLPATDEFREWAAQVEARGNVAQPVDIPFCDEVDKQALRALYEAADGPDWVRSDGWLDDENLGRWHGVGTDSVGRVSGLDLTGNGLSGHLPEAVGLLAGMTQLRIGDNALGGRLPLSLAGLALNEFDYGGTSVCVADDTEFQEWLTGIPHRSGTEAACPPLTDREILEHLYRNTDGRNWRQSAGWLTDSPLAQWDGVETDAAGRIVGLRLRRYGLSGGLPAELGQLSELRELDLLNNELSGSIPPELGGLANLTTLALAQNELSGSIPPELGQLPVLRSMRLSGNELSGSIPPELGGLAHLTWLALGRNEFTGSIPPELSDLRRLERLELDQNFLSGPIPPELGDLRSLEVLDLGRNQLAGTIPSEFGRLGALEIIRLADNKLTGGIPSELGSPNHLLVVDFSGNQLTGSIPSVLGRLLQLRELRLAGNRLSGSLPPELGDLADLATLDLADNQLAGSIPSELGDLANLDVLDLGNNQLSASLPAELGQAAALTSLDLRSNALSGPIPPEFSNLILLESLILAGNSGLAGPLPPEFLAVGRLERFMAGDTGLCRPPSPRYDAWFRAITDRRLVRCEGGAAVYLTQAVQSWDDPVPLLAGEPALLRVFVTAARESGATMPAVRTTFYIDGAERHSINIPASTLSIPTEIVEGDLSLSANAEIPAWLVAPNLEMVIEIDPEATLDPGLGVTKRIPDSGRMGVDVRSMPPFHLTLIPFLLAEDPDWSAVEDVSAMAADPDGHELLDDVRTLLPIAELNVAAHDPVMVSTPDIFSILRQVSALRIMEGGSGYWMGVWDGRVRPGSRLAAVGVAGGGYTSASIRNAAVMAHELGHNLSLKHAPCGSPNNVDPWFPHTYGTIGAWGYDFEQRTLVTPDASDIMSYCRNNRLWISDYFFNKSLNHRFPVDTQMAAAIAGPTRTLLLWGGRDAAGVPYLDPAFVIDAVPSLPRAGTEYSIVGADPGGTPLFSYTFDMPAIWDAEGEQASFVFALPVDANWADDLTSIMLSGPGGSAMLDGATDQPMAILRDPNTGRVRGFLSNPSSATQAAAAVRQGDGLGMEVLFSRGIPRADAWWR